MSMLFVLIPVALVIVAAVVTAFARTGRRDSFDDLTAPAMRAMQDDETPPARRPTDEADRQ